MGREERRVQGLDYGSLWFYTLWFYNRTRAGDESLSNLRVLEGKRQFFSIFYYVNMSTKSKTDGEFSRVSFGEIP